MGSFTNLFGGSPVSPAEVAYASYEFSTNLTLFWPQFANNNPTVAARFMNMTADVANLNVFMPDATLNSVGYDAILFNAGSNTFNVVTFNGGAIATIAPGQTYYLMLNNNTTQSGGWQTVQFGVGTGSASAAALAGPGLLAVAGLLAVNFTGVTVSNGYTLTAVARDVLQVWTGGSGTITLPASASVGNGFMFPLANNGSGSVTVATVGGDLIDGNPTSVFSQTQSGFILSTGTGWVTVGKGIQNTFAVTILNLNVAGSSNVTETSAQAQNIIQQFTGVLTGNINVVVPNTAQIYFAYNNTSGSFTLQMKTAAGTGVVITQGTHAILYCDGTNIVNAFTATVGSTLTLPVGSASSPPLNFQGSLTTGLFSAATNTVSTAAAGNEVTRYASQASAVNYITETSSSAGNPVAIGAAGTDTNISLSLAGKGSGSVNIATAVVTGGTINNNIIGGGTPAAITGTTITANAGFVGSLTGNVTGNVSGSSGSTTGNAATVTTNANLTGPVTSVGNATSIANNIELPGSPTTATQLSSDNSTKIATTAFVQSVAGTKTAPVVTVITSGTSTYTTPLGVLYLDVKMSGGGGGGGGSVSGSSGSSGGNTTFGTSLLTANGGSVGSGATGGAGGTATGGDINITGGGGIAGYLGTSSAVNGGNGGFNTFAGYGFSTGNVTGGNAPTNSGGGGGGGGTNGSNFSGGGGGAGGYLTKIITSPAPTYSYSIGAGGSGQTGSQNGGTGAAGIIEVIAYYQ